MHFYSSRPFGDLSLLYSLRDPAPGSDKVINQVNDQSLYLSLELVLPSSGSRSIRVIRESIIPRVLGGNSRPKRTSKQARIAKASSAPTLPSSERKIDENFGVSRGRGAPRHSGLIVAQRCALEFRAPPPSSRARSARRCFCIAPVLR